MRFRRLIAVSSLTVGALIGGAVQAHPHMISATPRANTAVSATNHVSLTFNEELLAPMSGGDVFMTGHPGVPHHPPMKIAGFKPSVGTDGKTLDLVSAKPLAKGSYQVRWQAVAADTHRVAGSFAFMVK
jgi:methionine-rich copper-binding protein CopC